MRAALFDIDGVLVDSPHELAWRESLERLMQDPWQALRPQTSYAPERYTSAVYQEYVAGKPRRDGAKAALDYFGVADPDGALVQQYCDVKQTQLIELIEAGRFTSFPDGLRLVLRMLQAGWKLGAASSSKNAHLFLKRVPLGNVAREEGMTVAGVGEETTLFDVFEADVCGRDGIPGKPAPAIFLTCAAELGVAPAACVVIEDAPSGAQAARAGGMRCIGIARLDDAALLQAAGADPVVTNLDEVDLEQF